METELERRIRADPKRIMKWLSASRVRPAGQ
jgi:hypothetical protein